MRNQRCDKQFTMRFSLIHIQKILRKRTYLTKEAADPISSGMLANKLKDTSSAFSEGSLSEFHIEKREKRRELVH